MDEARFREAEDVVWRSAGGADRVERWLELPRLGTRVRAQVLGRGPALVFVHGSPAVGSVYAALAPLLPQRTCIVLDRPGAGLSAPMDCGQLPPQELAAAVLEGVLDALELPSADLVANSLGGTWALWFAHRHPGRVGAIAQLGVPPFLPEMSREATLFHRLLTLPGLGWFLANARQDEARARTTFRQMGHARSLDAEAWGPEVFAFSQSMFNDTDTMRNERQLLRSLVTFRGPRPGVSLDDDLLRAIAAPVLWLWGEEDPFSPLEAGRRVASLMPNASLVPLPGVGHLPWMDDAPGIAAALTAFFARSAEAHPGPGPLASREIV